MEPWQMKQVFRILPALFHSILCLWFTNAYASISHNDHRATFLGPTLKAGYTSSINAFSGYSVAGELGVKNYRVSGTLGWDLPANQQLKVSAEYLWQRATYLFFSGNGEEEWVSQGAIGAAYEYGISCLPYDLAFDLNAYVSHARTKRLSSIAGVIVNNFGVTEGFLENRRIIGANAAGIAPGFSVRPWRGGRVEVDINYDKAFYDMSFSSNKELMGLGGTINFKQFVTPDVAIDLSAAVRKPFNSYSGTVDWFNVPYFGAWTLGLDGTYTVGKSGMPSTWDIGIRFNYVLDLRCLSAACNTYFKCEHAPEAVEYDFLQWMADPAVYLPQILGIPDVNVITAL